MIDIYGIKIHNQIDNDIFSYLLDFISIEKQERIKRFKSFKDAQRCLFGDLLPRYAICKSMGIENSQLKIDSNKYGKPIILEPQGVHFNISHSGDWVVCAVDNKPVGIDIEYIKPTDLKIAKRFFTVDEYNDLINKDRENRIKYFYILWTLKESYIKAIGKGLLIPLNSFSFRIENEDIIINTQNEFDSCFFYQYEVDRKHIISVCGVNNEFKPYIKEISVSQLFSSF